MIIRLKRPKAFSSELPPKNRVNCTRLSFLRILLLIRWNNGPWALNVSCRDSVRSLVSSFPRHGLLGCRKNSIVRPEKEAGIPHLFFKDILPPRSRHRDIPCINKVTKKSLFTSCSGQELKPDALAISIQFRRQLSLIASHVPTLDRYLSCHSILLFYFANAVGIFLYLRVL